jgi:hypothetical protein
MATRISEVNDLADYYAESGSRTGTVVHRGETIISITDETGATYSAFIEDVLMPGGHLCLLHEGLHVTFHRAENPPEHRKHLVANVRAHRSVPFEMPIRERSTVEYQRNISTLRRDCGCSLIVLRENFAVPPAPLVGGSIVEHAWRYNLSSKRMSAAQCLVVTPSLLDGYVVEYRPLGGEAEPSAPIQEVFEKEAA